MNTDSSEATTKRRQPSAKVRFEVFKRDGFKCQYCGRSAPDVLLEADHIEPVKEGGGNEILNLITACSDCNRGKGAVRLSDNSVLDKTRQQLEELQERRNQLTLLMEWKRGLESLEDQTLDEIDQFWAEKCPGFSLSEDGIAAIRKLLKQYSAGEIIDGIKTVANCYIKFNENGSATQDSAAFALLKLPGVCRVSRLPESDREAYYIRGIARRRLLADKQWSEPYMNRALADVLDQIKAAISLGVSADEIRKEAKFSTSWSQFTSYLSGLIDA